MERKLFAFNALLESILARQKAKYCRGLKVIIPAQIDCIIGVAIDIQEQLGWLQLMPWSVCGSHPTCFCISIASVAAIDVMHHLKIAPPVKPPKPFLPEPPVHCAAHIYQPRNLIQCPTQISLSWVLFPPASLCCAASPQLIVKLQYSVKISLPNPRT